MSQTRFRLAGAALDEARASFDYFWEQTVHGHARDGWGEAKTDQPGSIAATGFSLASLPIGIERGWVTRAQAEQRAREVLKAHQNTPRVHGFYYHFLVPESGLKAWNCEVSVIDTALLAAGFVTAGTYFGGTLGRQFDELVEGIEWDWYRTPDKKYFAMGYYGPERGFEGSWDHYAEQLLMCVLGAGSQSHPVPGSMLTAFERNVGSWGGLPEFVHCRSNSLFVHQFCQAFLPVKGLVDPLGLDWWENSYRASVTAQAWCTANPEGWKAFSAHSWGPTACDGPKGYSGSYGSPPSGDGRQHKGHKNDGTLAPCGMAGSSMFLPDQVSESLERLRAEQPKLWGRYGFLDAYNLEGSQPWYAERSIGIDKGITLLSLDNAETGLIPKILSQAAVIQRGLAACGFRRPS
ncbi:MAG: glucoamylase family protein [Spirochaetales bacterium]